MPTNQNQDVVAQFGAATSVANTVGARVRQARDRLNWEQQDLSDRSKVPIQTLKDIERGKTKAPRAKTLNALAEALGVEAGFLRTGEDPPNFVAPQV